MRAPVRARLLLAMLSACTTDRPTTERSDAERRTVAPRWSTADSARVEAILAPLIANHAFMGAVAFVRAGTIVVARGAGKANVGAGVDFTPAHVDSLSAALMELASCWTAR